MSTHLEIPMFIPVKGANLFSVIHETSANNPKGVVIFCHAFAEEKLWSHRVLVSYARLLNESGYHALRFDHFGHGDSDGDFSEATFDRYLIDVEGITDFIQNRYQGSQEIVLLGYRLGGTLAAIQAEINPDVNKLVLWDPILDGDRYMQEVLRINLTTQLAVYGEIKEKRDDLVNRMQRGDLVNIDGYELNHDMFRQVSDLNLKSPKGFQGKCLILQINKVNKGIKKDLAGLLDSYTDAEVKCAEEAPFWREIKESYFQAPNLFAQTNEWLEQSYE